MKNPFLYLPLLYLPTILTAQINESDSLKLQASLSLSGFWQEGNVETLIFRAKTNLAIRAGQQWVFKTQNSYVYQEFGKEKADEDILSLNFLYFKPKKKIYPFALGILSTNFRREIDLRYLLGAGVTFQFFQAQKDWLKLSLSTEYERTNFTQADFNFTEYNDNSSINTLRATLWANGKYHLFNNKIILTHEGYFQPSLRRSNNFRWSADLRLAFPIWKFLTLNINYLHTFESIVIQGQQQEDTFLTFGFTLKTK
ncbi:MAG: DUF481 domain-containing protein [Bacteroidota bacterium]